MICAGRIRFYSRRKFSVFPLKGTHVPLRVLLSMWVKDHMDCLRRIVFLCGYWLTNRR